MMAAVLYGTGGGACARHVVMYMYMFMWLLTALMGNKRELESSMVIVSSKQKTNL